MFCYVIILSARYFIDSGHKSHKQLWQPTCSKPCTWAKICMRRKWKTSHTTVVNDLRIRPQMAKFILTKWPHGSSLHTYRVPPGPLDQPWCTPIVSYSNRYTPTPELLGSLLLFWQAIFKLPLLLCYLMYLNVWWCKLTLIYRAKKLVFMELHVSATVPP